MTYEELIAMGLSEEQAKQVAEASKQETDAKQAELDAIKANRDAIIAEKRLETEKQRQSKAEADRLAEEKAKAEGDVKTLEETWRKREEALLGEIGQLKQEKTETTVKSAISKIAGKHASNDTNRRNLERLIRDFITVDETGNIVFLDENGDKTSQTEDDFSKHIATSGQYDSLIVGTQASGTGSSGVAGGAKASSDMTEEERVQMYNTNPELFKQTFGIKE